MALHLVGETLDRHRAHAAAQAGELIQLYRGIYVDATDMIETTILRHAVRIANYLYPNAYLAGASAVRLGPIDDGRLFLSGRRNGRVRLRTLEIIQNQAPDQASTIPVTIADDLGEMTLRASSHRQRFLEAFRRQSEHASAIDPQMRQQMAERLIEEYGDAAGAADALWTLARANRWLREAEAAEAYLRAGLHAARAPAHRVNTAFTVAWHGAVIGRLVHDGAEWRWTPLAMGGPPLVRETRPGSLPPFIESLLPEGWLAQVLAQRDQREVLRSGSRYMSNISIVADESELTTLPSDTLQGRLALWQDQGLFTGRYDGPAGDDLTASFQQRLAQLFAGGRTPRLSGVQIKAPMFLRGDGLLIAAQNEPFTHILKPAGAHGFEALPIVEWLSLSVARAADFEVPQAALIDMPAGLPPALLVERFDIRRSANDTRRIAMEDFCSVLDLPSERKYEGTIERMAKGLRPLSTDPTGDIETLFRRAVLAWLIADGDMHLKNLALLKIAEAGSERFTEVRLAPVYDAVTTVLFPGLDHDRMALKLNGKDDRLTPEDFLTLARTLEISQARALVLMAGCARRLVDALAGLAAPTPFARLGEPMLDRMRGVISDRAQAFI